MVETLIRMREGKRRPDGNRRRRTLKGVAE
jgi:hypothetical protein